MAIYYPLLLSMQSWAENIFISVDFNIESLYKSRPIYFSHKHNMSLFNN